MKKYITYLIIAGIMISYSACKKKDTLIFDQTSEQRITAELRKNQNLLISPQYGWKAALFPGNGSGIGFSFKFNDAGRVQTYADNLITSAFTRTFDNPDMSGYLIKQLQRPSLVFSTYSYLSYLADPVNGTRGKGFLSDNEFSFIRSTADTIVLEGNFNQSILLLIRATDTEYDAYTKGGMATLSTALNRYIISAAGKNIRLVLDAAHQPVINLVSNSLQRTISLSYQDEQGKTQTIKTRWAIAANSILLEAPISYNGFLIRELFYDSNQKSLYINWQSKRYELIITN